MRQLLIRALVGSGLLLSGTTAFAQYQPRGEYQYRYGAWQARMIDRVMGDLDRAQSSTIPFTGDNRRLERAREELAQARQSIGSGQYDLRDLDEAIFAIQRVVDANHISDRQREFLQDDLNRLRQMRNRMGNDWR